MSETITVDHQKHHAEFNWWQNIQCQLSSSVKLIAELLICLLYQWIKSTH